MRITSSMHSDAKLGPSFQLLNICDFRLALRNPQLESRLFSHRNRVLRFPIPSGSLDNAMCRGGADPFGININAHKVLLPLSLSSMSLSPCSSPLGEIYALSANTFMFSRHLTQITCTFPHESGIFQRTIPRHS